MAYLDSLEDAINGNRKAQRQTALENEIVWTAVQNKDAKISHTDPDIGYVVLESEPKGYLP